MGLMRKMVLAVRKLDAHTDYLSGRSVVLSLASDLVSDETKQKISEAIIKTEAVDLDCGEPKAPRVYSDSSLEDFVNE